MVDLDKMEAPYCIVMDYTMLDDFINPCVAELLFSIFHSFKAGIANAISSFK